MKTFPLKISSPEGDIFNGDAVMLSVRGTEGELAVMAGHIPFVSSVKPCQCKILLEDESEKSGTTDGGMLTVSKDKVVFLSGSFKWSE
ncbi:MAG: F0F1 ATP synthase subunit epsilon [Clostridia bacterium]|nr:F0F1 ATP synthase subunit epsilon [Clostridia bacterium]